MSTISNTYNTITTFNKYKHLFILEKSEMCLITNKYRICGVLGILTIDTHKFLIVATARDFVGIINSHTIWRLSAYNIIPFIEMSIEDEYMTKNVSRKNV